MLVVSATQPGEARLIVAAVPSDRAGITIRHDWDNMGQRQTDSGSVEFDQVVIEAHEVLNTPGPLGSVFASLRPCIAQLTLANVFLGIAEGALERARATTRAGDKPWFLSGVERASQDPYVLRHYGELWVELESARALADRAAEALEAAWSAGDGLTAEERGATALAIAAAKVKTTRAGLEVVNRMFDVTGARATTRSHGFDRYWRDLRTLTLHDPVDYKLRELGAWVLADELPRPTFYS